MVEPRGVTGSPRIFVMGGRAVRMHKINWGVFRVSLFVVFPTVLICLAGLEIGLRVLGQVPSNTMDGFHEQFNNSYRLKKNITKIVKTPDYSCTVHINELGFRDKASGPRKIGPKPYDLFLGESLTFGNGLDYEQTFVGVYAEYMESRGTNVVNLAVGGHGFLDQEELFRDFCRTERQKPVRVIICFSPLFIHGFDMPHTNMVVKNGYVFYRDNWIIPSIRLALGNMSSAYCYFRDNIRKIQAQVSNGRLRMARDMIGYYSKDNRLAGLSAAENLESTLDRLDDLIRGVLADPIYVYLPLSTDFMLEDLVHQVGIAPGDYDLLFYYKLIEKHCLRRGIPLINTFPALEELHRKGQVLNYARDAHYNAGASQVIADCIILGMQDQGVLQK